MVYSTSTVCFCTDQGPKGLDGTPGVDGRNGTDGAAGFPGDEVSMLIKLLCIKFLVIGE